MVYGVNNWVRTKSDEAAVDAGCWFDQPAADRVRSFFERFLRHSKGKWAGHAFELLPWQWENVVAPIFGWKRKDGLRRFRKCGVMIPKKNGKSTLLAGIGLYMLVADGEAGAEVYSCAASRDQASIIFNEAANMVDASGPLSRRLRMLRTKKHMEYATGRSTYDALSADVPTKDGINWHCLLFDELHTQRDWKLWNTLEYGCAARDQPLLFWISTAGIDRESLCYHELKIARDIAAGRTVNIEYHAYVCEASEDDNWTQPEVWARCNPSIGSALKEEEMARACAEAQASPLKENNFKRYRLNIWPRQVTRWIRGEAWDRCKVPIDRPAMHRAKCWAGLDLATTTDVNACVLVFPREGKFRLLPFFWIPEGALRSRERDNRTRLDHWAQARLIEVTKGDVVDYNVIRADLGALADEFKIKEICLDPWNATMLATCLQDDGFDVRYIRQGYASISSATKEFEKLVLSGMIEHDGNPVLDWMVSNTAVEQDHAGNLKTSKRNSMEKIDGTVAAINALARIIETSNKTSKYNKQGLDAI
jgi:phage terminase large subunit-like protein